MATRGGNQSWNRTAKLLDLTRIDFLFALVGDGRRWFIPASEVEATTALHLGGQKYSEFEVRDIARLEELVYGPRGTSVESPARRLGEYPSGQRMAPVKRPAQPSKVRILPPPSTGQRDASAGRAGIQVGRTIIGAKHRVTIPTAPLESARLARGDRLRVEALGEGSILMTRIPGEPATLPPVDRSKTA